MHVGVTKGNGDIPVEKQLSLVPYDNHCCGDGAGDVVNHLCL